MAGQEAEGGEKKTLVGYKAMVERQTSRQNLMAETIKLLKKNNCQEITVHTDELVLLQCEGQIKLFQH